MDIHAWKKVTTGKAINVDGLYGAQCWDLWSHYATNVIGVPYALTVTRAGGEGPHPGWACNVFHGAPRVLTDWFDVIYDTRAKAKPGDVAFWEKGNLYPGSHVAIVNHDNGATLACHSQNPNLPRTVTIPKRDLLGYLRPRKDWLMALTDQEQRDLLAAAKEAKRLAAELWRIHLVPGTAFPYAAVIMNDVRKQGGQKPLSPETVDALAKQLVEGLPDDLARRVADELARRLAA